MKKIITIEANRTGYSPEQCGHTVTIGDLIDYLSQYDEETPIYISNDNGYTYGAIRAYDINEIDPEDDEEEYE